VFARRLETGHHSKMTKVRRWFNWPSLTLFGGKIALVGWAYIKLGLYLLSLVPPSR
jgi:hypothetical protein